MRGDGFALIAAASTRTFQFTPLREGRHEEFVEKFKPKLFQFTPLREGRLKLRRSMHWSQRFQFTPLREGRPGQQQLVPFFPISIHAPT